MWRAFIIFTVHWLCMFCRDSWRMFMDLLSKAQPPGGRTSPVRFLPPQSPQRRYTPPSPARKPATPLWRRSNVKRNMIVLNLLVIWTVYASNNNNDSCDSRFHLQVFLLTNDIRMRMTVTGAVFDLTVHALSCKLTPVHIHMLMWEWKNMRHTCNGMDNETMQPYGAAKHLGDLCWQSWNHF